LADSASFAAGQRGEDRDRGVQTRVDVGVRECVTSQGFGAAEVLDGVGGDARLGLDRRCAAVAA